jgi:predicted AAA+ superfamily ATPase
LTIVLKSGIIKKVMKMLERKQYLDSLIGYKDINLVKVITGVRRCRQKHIIAAVQTIFRDTKHKRRKYYFYEF